jgi:hypothetical protein
MTIENENFFDFFGITADQVRTIYAESGKLFYAPAIHVPIPKLGIPESVIKSLGIKVITEKSQKAIWVDIFLWTSIVALIVTILYVIWEFTKPEPVLQHQKKDDVEENG